MKHHLSDFIDMAYEHTEIVYKWRNQPHIREVMYNSNLLDWKEHLQWFDSIPNDNSKIVKILYYNNKPYGIANFKFTNLQSNIGEWGFYIGEKDAPKGMGKLLAYKMLCYLFEELKIRKVCAEVLDYNQISLNFHGKVGFKQEGILRKHIFKNNNYCDVYLFSIFADEWIQKKRELEKELFN
ncbi:UDP-4-amino-4,6-dideoxy-N-acetyl-beta-L-altrosamine N-acetyltransferase [Solibacillus sp. FSL R7-0668]|uniref:UDP-4-amino-4, 6-dideoxy-N-acetyl-beta-L-altrosamine N-acetyltransferase n=1 Tax=Solibacillus sp. FSL R7-0668 TaxID=2921688 RepID=UPI0030FC21C9